LIEKRIGGWIERAMELNGHKASASITKSMAAGAGVTEFVVNYT